MNHVNLVRQVGQKCSRRWKSPGDLKFTNWHMNSAQISTRRSSYGKLTSGISDLCFGISSRRRRQTFYPSLSFLDSLQVRSYKSAHTPKRSMTGKRQVIRTFATKRTRQIYKPMDHRLFFQYLRLKTFTNEEILAVFDEIIHDRNENEKSESKLHVHMNHEELTVEDLQSFIFHRLVDIDREQEQKYTKHSLDDNSIVTLSEDRKAQIEKYANQEAHEAMSLLLSNDSMRSDTIEKYEFQQKITSLATELDMSRSIPISTSMLLVGSSVGIIIPIMPYVVQNLGISTGEFGMVVSSFAFAKLFANVPAAVLVERHGRKPYLVYSLLIISCGVGGIGLATQFEHLLICRTLTGIGVSLLSTAATLSVADSSTPLNRARTMAPMMSAFAAGTALGPAVGGILADKIGINNTFLLVGGMYLVSTAVNNVFLKETKMIPEIDRKFPWHKNDEVRKKMATNKKKGNNETVINSLQNAVSQWQPLLEKDKVRNVVFMNGFYWVALSGAQMTLLPLFLTDPNALALSPTSVGEIYMGMSLVQVLGNPVLARYIDKIGKVPGIVTGCSLLSASMFTLPFCTEVEQLAMTLGFWSLGSTMLSTAPTAYISDHVKEDERAQAIALLRTAGDIGLLVGASSTGAVADILGMNIAVHSSASLLLLATGWFTGRRIIDWQQSKQVQNK